MENLEFRNPLLFLRIDPSHESGTWEEVGEAWTAVENEECQKISSMSNVQFFDLIEHILSDPKRSAEPIETQYVSYLGSREIYDLDGWDSARYFKYAIKNVLRSLVRRLEGKFQLKSWLIDRFWFSGELSGDDIRNVKEVMVGDISLADHTALTCIHKYMIRMNKRRVPIIRKYKFELEEFITNITNMFAILDGNHLMEIREMQWQEEQDNMAIKNRPRRQRKAPERLNIISCKGKSYQQ